MNDDVTPVPWNPNDLQAAYERGRARAVPECCPMCGSTDYTPQHVLVTGIETTYKSCDECDHQWGHE